MDRVVWRKFQPPMQREERQSQSDLGRTRVAMKREDPFGPRAADEVI